MDFAEKKGIAANGTAYFDGTYQKPLICPRCDFGTDGPITACAKVKYGKLDLGYVISICCTHCGENFMSLYSYDKSGMHYLSCLPQPSGAPLHAGLCELSPRFASMHKQAESAELSGLHDVAAMGYRAALEILVKDYAIIELKLPKDEVVKKKLAAAIGAYLNQSALVKTADVVRILGNDHTHYQPEFPQHDFSILKHYYNIFINLVATQYDIAHPPVERTK